MLKTNQKMLKFYQKFGNVTKKMVKFNQNCYLSKNVII